MRTRTTLSQTLAEIHANNEGIHRTWRICYILLIGLGLLPLFLFLLFAFLLGLLCHLRVYVREGGRAPVGCESRVIASLYVVDGGGGVGIECDCTVVRLSWLIYTWLTRKNQRKCISDVLALAPMRKAHIKARHPAKAIRQAELVLLQYTCAETYLEYVCSRQHRWPMGGGMGKG